MQDTATVPVNRLAFRQFRQQLELAVVDTLKNQPHLTYPRVAEMYRVSRSLICIIARKHGIHRPTGRKPAAGRKPRGVR